MGRKEPGVGRPPVDAVDGRGSSIPTDPKAYLRSIVLKYSGIVRDYQLNTFRERESVRSYFEDFRRSTFFRQDVYPQAVVEAERTDDKRLDEKAYGHAFAGFLFGQMAYADMAGWSMTRTKVVLSPQEVHGLYKILYPKKRVIHGHFGQDTIEGVYQPDGLVVNKQTLEIEEVLEYKLFNGQEDFESQYNGFMKQRYREHPELFRRSQFTFITPSDFTIQEYHGVPGVQFEVLPVAYREFGGFVQDTYHRYLNGRNIALVDRIRHRDATPAETQPVTLVLGEAADVRQPLTT